MTTQAEGITATVNGVSPNGLEHFDRTGPDAHFALPARPTVKQQLEYFSRYAATRSLPLYLRLWDSAQAVISEWVSESLPDPKVDLTTITDPNAGLVIMWAGNVVLEYMNDLNALPKV